MRPPRRVLTALLAPLLAAFLLASAGAEAVEPDEVLDDPALEARARGLSAEVRCLVCQNESIDSSNADLAKELRILVRERLQAGDSDAEVKAYLVDRYGDFVLFRPPLKPGTYLLWYGPFALFALALIAVVVYLRRQSRAKANAPAALDAAEQAELARLLGDEGAAAPNDGAPPGHGPGQGKAP